MCVFDCIIKVIRPKNMSVTLVRHPHRNTYETCMYRTRIDRRPCNSNHADKSNEHRTRHGKQCDVYIVFGPESTDNGQQQTTCKHGMSHEKEMRSYTGHTKAGKVIHLV